MQFEAIIVNESEKHWLYKYIDNDSEISIVLWIVVWLSRTRVSFDKNTHTTFDL